MTLTFLITAGPTLEYLDPVRYFSNASSGTMGYALARAAVRRGYSVILVSGPVALTAPKKARLVPVVSARGLFNAVKDNMRKADIIIGAAAVADYRPEKTAREKIKKTSGPMTVKLVSNPDSMRYAGAAKKGRIVVGFALETGDVLRRAYRKLSEKKFDLIVANMPDAVGSQKASAWIIDKKNNIVELADFNKNTLAERIIREAVRLWEHRLAD